MFFPSGAESLDAALIDDAWKWLQDYPREQKDFMTAIGHFVSKNYGDSISNSYLVAEGLARTILQNSKTLDNNKEELLRVCKLSREWKSFLSNYFDYANTYKRHASEKRGDINPIEAEAFLYFTGIIVRLLIESTKTT